MTRDTVRDMYGGRDTVSVDEPWKGCEGPDDHHSTPVY